MRYLNLIILLCLFVTNDSLAEVPCENIKEAIETAVSNTPIDGITNTYYEAKYDRVTSCTDTLIRVQTGPNSSVLKPFRVALLEKTVLNSHLPNNQIIYPLIIPPFINHLSKITSLNSNPELINWQNPIYLHDSNFFIHIATLENSICGPGQTSCFGGLYDSQNSYDNVMYGGEGMLVTQRPTNSSVHQFQDLPSEIKIASSLQYQYVNKFNFDGTCNGILKNGFCLQKFPIAATFRSVFLMPLASFSTPTPTASPTPTSTGTITPQPTQTPTPYATIGNNETPTPTPGVCETEEGADAKVAFDQSEHVGIEIPLDSSEAHRGLNAPNGNDSDEKGVVEYETKKDDIVVSKKSRHKEIDADPKPGLICTGDNKYDGLPTLADIARTNLNQKNYFKDLQLVGRSGIHACNLFAYSAAARYAWNLRERNIITADRYNQIVGRTKKKRGFNYSNPLAHQSYAAYKSRGFKCLTRTKALSTLTPNMLRVGVTLIRTPPISKKKQKQGHLAICSDKNCFEAGYSWEKAKKYGRSYRGTPARMRAGFQKRATFTHVCWLPEQEPQMNGYLIKK